MELTKQIRNFIAENPNCNFNDIATKAGLPGSTTCGEIWESLDRLADGDCALYDRIVIDGDENKETFRLRPGSQCFVEAVQDITVNVYQELYNKMEEPDSRALLQDIRIWAQEFEAWWWSLKESDRDRIGYFEAIDSFCQALLTPNNGISRDSNLQEFTARAMSHEFCDKCWDVLFYDRNMGREAAFAKIREWADEFWSEYKDRNVLDDLEEGASYYDKVDAFLRDKISQ